MDQTEIIVEEYNNWTEKLSRRVQGQTRLVEEKIHEFKNKTVESV